MGRPKGRKSCDLREILRFLTLFKREPRNLYQIYRNSKRFDIKKLYRYLRYCIELKLIELDRVDPHYFLPAKYYRLTEKGQALLSLFSDFCMS